MALIEQLKRRGVIHQLTDEALDAVLAEKPRVAYAGFDPSYDNLHIGNLVPILGLARLQRAGHRPIALVGGGTGLIGDPSGKTEERRLLTVERVEANCAAIRGILERFLDFDGARGALLLNNADWILELRYAAFLREIGKHFSVNAMLGKESVRSRIEDREQGMSYTEFSYMLLQANDYLHLHDHHACVLQIGGSDQWGNIVAGIDLIRRMRGVETYGFTLPLITKADGSKFGKTEEGSVWLGEDGTSPYDLYQYMVRTDDRDVLVYLHLLTLLDEDRVAELEAEVRAAPEKRVAQGVLAEEVTRLAHGDEGLRIAERATRFLYGGDPVEFTDEEIAAIFGDVASAELGRAAVEGEGLPLVDALVTAGAASSKGAARRLVESGGVYVNNVRAADPGLHLTAAHLASRSYMVLRKGKKDYFLLQFK